MEFQLTPELLAYIVGVILSLAFNYIPKFNEWYGALDTRLKSLIMAGAIILSSVVIYGGTCLGWFITGITCDQSGIVKLISIVVSTLIANQATYLLSPDSKTVIVAKDSRE